MQAMLTHQNSLPHTEELGTIYKNRVELDKNHKTTRNYSIYDMLNFETI
jgi:hypothetical protein